MARLKWFALALAAVTAPAFAGTGLAAGLDVARIGMAMVGDGSNQEKPKDHWFDPNKGVRKGGAMQSCGSDEVGQSYPGFTGTYCRVGPPENAFPIKDSAESGKKNGGR